MKFRYLVARVQNQQVGVNQINSAVLGKLGALKKITEIVCTNIVEAVIFI